MIETADLARTVEKIIQDRPDMWEFEQLRLLEIASQPSFDGGLDERTIRTAAGTVVVKTDFSAARPAITVSAALFDSGNPVGSIEARHSIRKQLFVTALLGMLSSSLGYLLFFIFRTYPIRRLENALVDLQRAQEEEQQNRKTAERLAEEMAIIAYIGRVVSSTLDINQVFERVATEVRKLIPYDRLLVNLKKTDDVSEFVVVYSSGIENPRRRLGDSYPCKGSSTGVVMSMRSGILIQPHDAEEIKDLYPNLYATFKTGLRSTMSIPLISMDEVIGSLTFRSKKLKAYNEQDLRLAEKIGMQIAGAIANAKLFNDLNKTENSMRESEGRFRGMVEQAAVGVAEIEINTGRFLTANRQLCEMLGRTEEELINTTFQAITHPEDLHLHEGKTRMMLAGKIGHYSLEKRYLRKDGGIVWVNITVSPLWKPGDNPERNIAVVEDITDRKRMKEESDRHSRQLTMLHETSVELMAELNIEALLQSIAQHSLDLIGGTTSNVYIYRTETDLMERVVSVGPTLIPSKTTRRRGEGMVGQTWAQGAPMLINDYHAWPGRTKEFDSYPSRALIAAPFYQGTEILGIINIMANLPHQYTQADIDMLNMFAAQAAIAIHNAQLYDRIKLELVERKRAEEEKRGLMERLQRAEKMEALGQLAGGVAHDLNNVLGILSGYSELLLEEIPEGHRSRGHAEKILQSTEKGAAIIQDLLTLARRGVTASDVINLNSVVSGFLKTPVFEKMKDYHPRVTFRTECDKNVLNIKGSPIHLEKTLINLVSNAAESISGKGEVTIRTESRYLDKAVRGYDEVKEGDYAVLTVSDTGMGIPAENREKIFEPFYTKKTMGRSGTGLGLSIVWGTVKDHHGYIDVQTEVGTGTTFTLYFPVTREELIAPQQKEPIERYMGNGESVLVVDDIAEQRDVAARLLTRLGYEVHVVSGGEEAVEYLKGHTADILVLDMIMTPGIDGLETYQRVLAINPKQKAILVSGFSETERVTKAQKLGAGAYVKKPYLMEKIGEAIRNELNR